MSTLRGFGFTFSGGTCRNWYVGSDGVQRWSDNDRPCDLLADVYEQIDSNFTAQAPAIPSQSPGRGEGNQD